MDMARDVLSACPASVFELSATPFSKELVNERRLFFVSTSDSLAVFEAAPRRIPSPGMPGRGEIRTEKFAVRN